MVQKQKVISQKQRHLTNTPLSHEHSVISQTPRYLTYTPSSQRRLRSGKCYLRRPINLCLYKLSEFQGDSRRLENDGVVAKRMTEKGQS